MRLTNIHIIIKLYNKYKIYNIYKIYKIYQVYKMYKLYKYIYTYIRYIKHILKYILKIHFRNYYVFLICHPIPASVKVPVWVNKYGNNTFFNVLLSFFEIFGVLNGPPHYILVFSAGNIIGIFGGKDNWYLRR